MLVLICSGVSSGCRVLHDLPVVIVCCSMQNEWENVEYPHGKSRPVREPTQYIRDYKMDEIGDLIWIGGIMSKHASGTFQKAFGHLQAAAAHYLFGFDATASMCRDAAHQLYTYAEDIEMEVKSGRVRSELTHYTAGPAAAFTILCTHLNCLACRHRTNSFRQIYT